MRAAGRFAAAFASVLGALTAVACVDDGTAPASGQRQDAPRELRVFAASSLTEAFTALAAQFERAQPGVRVTLTFGASSALARQINDGAPADVFAAADESTMADVVAAGNARAPVVIARNRLALLVEKGNPYGIASLADLARDGVVVVMCATEVPCGRLAAATLAAAGVTIVPASLEENVKAAVAKVTLGEADAAIVYATDAAAAEGAADRVDIHVAAEPPLEAVYPMAIASETPNLQAALAWTEFLSSDEAMTTLTRFGFLPP